MYPTESLNQAVYHSSMRPGFMAWLHAGNRNFGPAQSEEYIAFIGGSIMANLHWISSEAYGRIVSLYLDKDWIVYATVKVGGGSCTYGLISVPVGPSAQLCSPSGCRPAEADEFELCVPAGVLCSPAFNYGPLFANVVGANASGWTCVGIAQQCQTSL